MSVTQMSIGDSATATVGPSASVLGRQNTGLMNLVKDTIFAGVILDTVTGNKAPGLRPGDSLMNVLSGNVEVYSNKPNSELTNTMMGIGLLGFMATLIDNNTAPQPTQEQMRAEAIAKEDMRLADIAKEAAQDQEAFAAEERRKAFFAKPPRM